MKATVLLTAICLALVVSSSALSTRKSPSLQITKLPATMLTRKNFLQSVAVCTALLTGPGDAFSMDKPQSASTNSLSDMTTSNGDTPTKTIAYKPLSIPLGPEFGEANVPVACWYPVASTSTTATQESLTYPHRISIRRIGQMLARWDWIPQQASKNFALTPSMPCANGNEYDLRLPSKAAVVLLAHGYLGSRFDLSHIAEALAAEGFVCFSPEFPESLAASYDRCEGLDRAVITNQLLQMVEETWKVQPTSYGIVGHSLGTGTAIRTGDATWTRVVISGNPASTREIPGNVLFLSSMGDNVVSLRNRGGLAAIASDYVQLQEQALVEQIPGRAALVFDREDAPNHISFLAEGVNDAMVDFLSPLLPEIGRAHV